MVTFLLLLLKTIAFATSTADDFGQIVVSISASCKETFQVHGSFTGIGKLVNSSSGCLGISSTGTEKVATTDAYLVKEKNAEYAISPAARMATDSAEGSAAAAAAAALPTAHHPKTMYVTRWGASSIWHRLFDHMLPAWILCHTANLCSHTAASHPSPVQVFVLDEGGFNVPSSTLDHLERILFGLPWVQLHTPINVTSDLAVIGGWGSMHLYHWGRGSKNQHGFVWRDELEPWLKKLRKAIFKYNAKLGHVDQACRETKTSAASRGGRNKRDRASPTLKRKTPILWMRRQGARKGETGGSRVDNGGPTYRWDIEGVEATVALLVAEGYEVREVDMGSLSFAEVATMLSCPKILIGIEGAAFANSLLLKSGGILQISFLKPTYEFDGNVNVVNGFHSSVAQYFSELQDTQYYTYGRVLHPKQMLTVVNEMNLRIQQQLLIRKENAAAGENSTSSYSYRQYYGPDPRQESASNPKSNAATNPGANPKRGWLENIKTFLRKGKLPVTAQPPEAEKDPDPAGVVVEQWPDEIPVQWKRGRSAEARLASANAVGVAVREAFTNQQQGGWQYIWKDDGSSSRQSSPASNAVPSVQIHGGSCKVLHNVFVNWWGLIVELSPAQVAAGNTGRYVNGAAPCLADPSTETVPVNAAAVADLPIIPKLISFAGMWQNGVWHFLFEALANVAALLPIPTDVVVHIAEKNNWSLQWLHLIGIGETFGHKIVSNSARASIAMFPKLGACGGNSLAHINFLRNTTSTRLNQLYGEPAPPCNDLLLVRRTKSRKIGEKAFAELFERMETLAAEKGMTVTVFDDGYLSSELLHQLHHFRRACAVVAPHGAGLTMVLAMQPGSCVIEIHPKGRTRQDMYKSLSGHLRLQYARSRSIGVGNSSNADEGEIELQYDDGGAIAGGVDLVERTVRRCKSFVNHVKVPVR